MPQYKGASTKHEIPVHRRRKDTRPWSKKASDFLYSPDGIVFVCMFFPILAVALVKVPFAGELLLLIIFLFRKTFVIIGENRAFDFPYRVPKLANVNDGSTKKGESKGEGITLLGNDIETKEQIYAGNSDLRTHMLVLGTTGSGKPQPNHANVMTPSGWRTMGSLKAGDLVCTPDGKTAPILRVFEQGEQLVYKVKTWQGRSAEATGDHLWRVLIKDRAGNETSQTITTDGIKILLDEGSRVFIPKVTRRSNGNGAKFHKWVRIFKVQESGLFDCRCIEIDSPEHLYITDNLLVTHNTEFLLGLVFNALVQNTGFIYVDGKGDPKLQKEIFRLARHVGREDDLLIINFITSGRDFVEKQSDKVTNNMNIMGNTSSGMLIELIVSMMDDSGGGGDMWKGRAISFVASLTRPLTYLRDKGFINLSPEKYLEYFELNVIEDLVWDHNGKYGEMFDVIVAPLRSYLMTLPGYQKSKKKQQEQKTLEQHGFIVMQLTRIFNDLNFNYGHIFRTKVGDVDFFDVVINRRLLVVLLPALERAPDSLRMLGKMIVGSIKQMMAGCLGNKVEGVVREIIDSRPTNAKFPFYCILDEYGYYSVIGFAVAPAQARSLGFSVIFAAQDFSSLKKSSAEEADATWENTNVRAVGRITSGRKSETWERIEGAAGEIEEARSSGYLSSMGAVNEKFRQQETVSVERRSRLDYDDLAGQENGEFTFLVGKKEKKGSINLVKMIRGMGFYTAGKAPKEIRINDLIPVEAPEPADLPQNKKAIEALVKSLMDGTFPKTVRSAIKGDPTLASLHAGFERNYSSDRPKLSRPDAARAMMGWFITDGAQITPTRPKDTPQAKAPAAPIVQPETTAAGATSTAQTATQEHTGGNTSAPVTAVNLGEDLQQAAADKALLAVADQVISEAYTTGTPAGYADDDEVIISASVLKTNIVLTDADSDAFRTHALPLLNQHLFMLDTPPTDDEWAYELSVADKQKLLEMEIVATGKPFNSLDEKYAAEERIEETRKQIARETTYIEEPKPNKKSEMEIFGQIGALSAECREIMKKQIT